MTSTKPGSQQIPEGRREASGDLGNLTPNTRLDPPHEPAAASEPPEAEHEAATTLVTDEAISEQVRLQAEQLANHLRARQREIDARQAALNSQLARFESDARTARLWLAEREAELAIRSEALARREQELAERGERESREADKNACFTEQQLRDAEAAVCEREKSLAQQQAMLTEREQMLAEREQELEGRLARLAAAEAAAQRSSQQAAERLAAAERSEALTLRMAAEHQRAMADLEKKREAVQRRAEHVDQCRAGLRQLHDQLAAMQRETLEIRLATEELWVRLSGAAPPATLVQSLGQIRARLAGQYSQANTELARRRQELERIREELSTRHGELAQQKRQFDRWAAAQQQDSQQQASRLIARERHLHHIEVRLREQFRRSGQQRARYLRRLHRTGKPVAV